MDQLIRIIEIEQIASEVLPLIVIEQPPKDALHFVINKIPRMQEVTHKNMHEIINNR